MTAVALVLTACGGSDEDSSGSDSSSGGTTAVSVGVIPIVDVAPIHLGQEQGLFADRGIELELVPGSGGAAAVPGIIAGDFQVAFGNVTSVLPASSEGLPLQVVAEGQVLHR
jgi:NitT/TauT family transport system substrate-binding protein